MDPLQGLRLVDHLTTSVVEKDCSFVPNWLDELLRPWLTAQEEITKVMFHFVYFQIHTTFRTIIA